MGHLEQCFDLEQLCYVLILKEKLQKTSFTLKKTQLRRYLLRRSFVCSLFSLQFKVR